MLHKRQEIDESSAVSRQLQSMAHLFHLHALSDPSYIKSKIEDAGQRANTRCGFQRLLRHSFQSVCIREENDTKLPAFRYGFRVVSVHGVREHGLD